MRIEIPTWRWMLDSSRSVVQRSRLKWMRGAWISWRKCDWKHISLWRLLRGHHLRNLETIFHFPVIWLVSGIYNLFALQTGDWHASNRCVDWTHRVNACEHIQMTCVRLPSDERDYILLYCRDILRVHIDSTRVWPFIYLIHLTFNFQFESPENYRKSHYKQSVIDRYLRFEELSFGECENWETKKKLQQSTAQAQLLQAGQRKKDGRRFRYRSTAWGAVQ